MIISRGSVQKPIKRLVIRTIQELASVDLVLNYLVCRRGFPLFISQQPKIWFDISDVKVGFRFMLTASTSYSPASSLTANEPLQPADIIQGKVLWPTPSPG
ncbi:hypothetical protein HanRHA438_Chr04g0166711 [Helianthus annuus]|nr:hypothetical protein HanHA89_Chr04g0141651 [Helianthus annuus]KAJ0638462.1 hypothetical protein HanHA300_Chr00c0115g0712711 [Helianthus annuus]KAJ0926060.1 hypothetical protein HanRHA438_Chr04g0166711 [Helianthus annuus]KAJ0930546.1 hypothetical protein HanPSC8_Chr04g0150571 [Helianthus annuus]